MKIAVCIKQVPDTETRIKISDDKKWIKEDDINFILNPYDELAVEEALKIKEKFPAEVTIISLGPSRVTSAIRSALAMGADKAIHIVTAEHPVDPQLVADGLSRVLREDTYDLILCGKQAIDDDHAQVTVLLSEILNIPGITVVTKLDIQDRQLVAERQIEGGIEKISCSMPAIISAQRGLNQPRYASLKGIMAARRIPILEKTYTPGEGRLEISELNYPPQKPAGRIVGEGPAVIPELIRLLREEAKIQI